MKNESSVTQNMRIFLITLLVIILALGIIFGGEVLYLRSKLSKINTLKIPNKPEQVGANNIENDNGIQNILLMGVNSKDNKDDLEKSSSMMIFTIDKKNKKLKLTSIVKNSLVSIEGHGNEKLTNANEYGGPVLAIKTVNQNFNMDILDYLKIDFCGLEKVIDNIGGININVNSDEIPYTNSYIDEMDNIEHKKVKHIEKAGLQNLNGIQAIAYSKVRYISPELEKIDRQRIVLTAVVGKLGDKNKKDIPQVVNQISPYIETNLKSNKIMKLFTYVLIHKMLKVEQSQIPYDDMYKDAVVNGTNVLVWDKKPNVEKLHKFIFETK